MNHHLVKVLAAIIATGFSGVAPILWPGHYVFYQCCFYLVHGVVVVDSYSLGSRRSIQLPRTASSFATDWATSVPIWAGLNITGEHFHHIDMYSVSQWQAVGQNGWPLTFASWHLEPDGTLNGGIALSAETIDLTIPLQPPFFDGLNWVSPWSVFHSVPKHVLPYRVHVLPFIINVMSWAAVAYTIPLLVGRARRIVRRRSGRCPQCGYPAAGLETCPECGRNHRKASRPPLAIS